MRFLLLLPLLLAACGTTRPVTPGPHPPPTVGVLVMAHGGPDDWNQAVGESISDLRSLVPTALAYGMADPQTLRPALDSLKDRGVERVVVVRMFLSGRSFEDQTRYLLGISAERPEAPFHMGRSHGNGGDPPPLRHPFTVATHGDGLMTASQTTGIMVERAATLSEMPARESVLLIAHGMEDEDDNADVIWAMHLAADSLRRLGFARVEAATLREDWKDEREAAERSIRSYVEIESSAGRKVIVVPFRLHGFGPYAEVLRGLEYRAGTGLLPHRDVAEWVRTTASRIACSAGWGPVIAPCPAPAGF